jgi:hypothetical protein
MLGPALNSVLANTPLHYFLLCSASAAGGGGLGGSGASAPRFYCQRDNGSYNNNNNLAYAGSNAITVREWRHDGTNWSYYEGGVQLDTVVIALSGLSAVAMTLGISGATFGSMDWYELLCYDRALTAGELANTMTALMARAALLP